MQQPFHIISQPGASWTTERIAGVGFVGLLHVIAIWAILNGLAQKFVKIVEPPPIAWTQPVTHQPPPPPAPPIPHVQPTEPTTTAVPLPRFTIQSQDPPQVIGSTTPLVPPQPPVADTYASGISSTHSPPDYPPLARRLGEQGSVRLGLTISATGEVTGATVVQSSGFADLDQMATDWVIGHWKYKPATHDGVAVPTQTQAVVVFNLKNAR